MHRVLPCSVVVALWAVLAGVPASEAQDTRQVSEAPKDVTEKMTAGPDTTQGWSRKARIGGTFSYSHSDNFVGALDGSTFQAGFVTDATMNLNNDRSSWENILKIQLTQSRTPAISDFIKSLDNFDFQTTYYYRLKDPSWIGPFARARVITQMFQSYGISAQDQTVRTIYLDGSENVFTVPAEEKLELTPGFQPLILSQNVGFFATPKGSEAFNFRAKLGFGLQEIVVGDSAFAIQDDSATPELELKQLEQSVQGGAVMDINLAGKPAENLTWKVDTSVFFEAFTNSDIDADAFNMDLNGLVSVSLTKWASLDYLLLVKKVPRIVDEWQVQTGFLLNIGMDVF